MSLAKPKDGFGKEGMGDGTIWQLRNRLLESIETISTKDSGWLEITEPSMVDGIVCIYGNALNRKILNSCLSKPRTMMEILSITRIPQTTGYRKITSLVKDNLLFACHVLPRNGRRNIIRYLSTFKEMEFHISENKEWVRARLQQGFLQEPT